MPFGDDSVVDGDVEDALDEDEDEESDEENELAYTLAVIVNTDFAYNNVSDLWKQN